MLGFYQTVLRGFFFFFSPAIFPRNQISPAISPAIFPRNQISPAISPAIFSSVLFCCLALVTELTYTVMYLVIAVSYGSRIAMAICLSAHDDSLSTIFFFFFFCSARYGLQKTLCCGCGERVVNGGVH